jgi:hypothetical protein
MLRLFRNSLFQLLMSVWVALGVIGLCSGCATAGASKSSVEIHVSDNGLVTVDERIVALDDLPGRLKQMGAGRNTMVRVNVGRKPNRRVLASISSTLASNGFSRFIFLKPRESVSFMGPDDGDAAGR